MHVLSSPRFHLLLLASLVPLPSWSQDLPNTSPPTPAALPETIVTGRTTSLGTRSERPLADLPVAISIITPDDIARIAPLSFDDLIRTLPNVETMGGPRYLGEQIVIRGEGGNAVTVRIDDARQNFVSGHSGQRFFAEPDFLSGIDVLRGAGSFLYGSGSAGVVQLTTFDPADILNDTGQYGLRLRNTYNDVSEEWTHSVLGAVAHQNLAFLYGFANRQGNDIRLARGAVLADSAIDRNSHLAKLVWTPSPAHRLEFGLALYDTADEGGANPQANVGVSNALVGRGVDYRQWTGDYRFDPASTDLVNLDLTVYYNETSQVRNYLGGRSDLGRVNRHALDVFGVDLSNRSEFAAGPFSHTLVSGLEFFTESQGGTETRDTFFLPGAPGFSGGRPNAEADHLGLFLTDEMEVNDRFRLFGGVRYDTFRTERTVGTAVSQQGSALSPNIGFDLDVTERVSLVGRYSRAFTQPTLNLLYQDGSHFGVVPGTPFFRNVRDPQGGFFLPRPFGGGVPPAGLVNVNYFEEVFIPNPNLEPETSDNFELGVHFEEDDVAGGELSSRLTGFYKRGQGTVDTEIVGSSVTTPFAGFANPENVPSVSGGPLFPGGPSPTFFTGLDFAGNLQQAFRQAVNREETQIYGAEFTLDYDAGGWFGALTAGSVRGQDTTTGADLNTITGDQLSSTVGFRLFEDRVSMGAYGIWNAGMREVVSDPTLQTSGYDIYGLFSTLQVTPQWQLRFGVHNLFDQAHERTNILLGEPGRNVFISSTITF